MKKLVAVITFIGILILFSFIPDRTDRIIALFTLVGWTSFAILYFKWGWIKNHKATMLFYILYPIFLLLYGAYKMLSWFNKKKHINRFSRNYNTPLGIGA